MTPKFYIDKQLWPNGRFHAIILIQPNIGSLTIDVYPDEQDTAYISYFYIHKKYRNLGYGTKLLKKAESFIKNNHINNIGLWVSKGMTADYAYDWYIKNGYTLKSNIDNDEYNIFLIKHIG